MKRFFLRNMFWLNLFFLVLPLIYLVPDMQRLDHTNNLLAGTLLLLVMLLNSLAVMLLVFVLYGMYGKALAIMSFILWVVVASFGGIGLVTSIAVASGYWISQKSYIYHYINEVS